MTGFLYVSCFFFLPYYFHVLFYVKSHNQKKKITTWRTIKDTMISLVFITHNTIEPGGVPVCCGGLFSSFMDWRHFEQQITAEMYLIHLVDLQQAPLSISRTCSIFSSFFCITNQLSLQMNGLKGREAWATAGRKQRRLLRRLHFPL